MRLLDLFSGIGGFSIGLERAGFHTVAFCEVDPFCRRVLAKHWPKVPQYDDIRTLTSERLTADGISVDAICGGFPCQDISVAGKGAGIDGERSGLWGHYSRIIGEIRPKFVIVENVSALCGRGLDRVLGDISALGYDAEWHCIPASYVGAPHRRDRIWIVAYPMREQHKGGGAQDEGAAGEELSSSYMADSSGKHDRVGETIEMFRQESESRNGGFASNVSDSDGPRLAIGQSISGDDGEEQPAIIGSDWWAVEPGMGRVANGIPHRVDRLRSLGNSIVPQVAEVLGRAIMAIPHTEDAA